MSTRPSFWELHPEVRDFAASLDAQGLNIPEIRERIRQKFGQELVPTQSRLCGLRRGILEGRWQVPAEPKGSEAAKEDLQEGAHLPEQGSSRLRWWDRLPEIRDAALAMLPFENHFILSELTRRFKTLPKDTPKRLCDLRYGVLQGRWSVPKDPVLPDKAAELIEIEALVPAESREVPVKAINLLKAEWVSCQIRGVMCLSGRACLTRQLSAAKRHGGRNWKTDKDTTALFPGYGPCAGCPHWIPDAELQAAQEIMYGKSPPRPTHDGRRIL